MIGKNKNNHGTSLSAKNTKLIEILNPRKNKLLTPNGPQKYQYKRPKLLMNPNTHLARPWPFPKGKKEQVNNK